VKTVSDKAVRHSLASIRAKWLVGDVLLRENVTETDPPLQKRRLP